MHLFSKNEIDFACVCPLKTTKKAAFFLPKKEGRLNHFLVSSAHVLQRARTPATPHNSFSWLPTPNGHSSHNKSARTRTPATKDGENGKLGKKEKTWENLRNMEKVVYLCNANPKIGYPGKFPARGKPSPTLPNV